MATLDLPAWGYGIRYQYGMFRQSIIDGFQHEQPDYWLNFGNPWEIERLNVSYPVKFYGHVSVVDAGDGRQAFRWNAGEAVTVREMREFLSFCRGERGQGSTTEKLKKPSKLKNI